MAMRNAIRRPLVNAVRRPMGAGLSTDPLQSLIAELYGAGEQGAFFVSQPVVNGQQVLFQDAAGTVPITADGDPVGRWVDLSGNGKHATQSVSGARPVYRTDGTLHWLEFDGVSSALLIDEITPGSGSADVIAGLKKLSDSGAGYAFNHDSTSLKGLYLGYDDLSLEAFHAGRRATSPADYAQPFTGVVGLSSSLSAPSLTLREGGHVIATSTGTTGGGVFEPSPSAIGRRSDTGLRYFNGEIYGMVVRYGTLLSDSSRSDVEQYIAALTGVTL